MLIDFPANKCRLCGVDIKVDSKTCELCKSKNYVRDCERRAALKNNNICTKCGFRESAEDRDWCEYCLRINRERKQRLRKDK